MNTEMIIFLVILGVIAIAEVVGVTLNILSYKNNKVWEGSFSLVTEQMNRERNNFEEYKRNATETIRYWVGLVEKAQVQGFIPNENKNTEKEDNGDEKVS